MCSTLEAEKEQLQTQLADVEAIRIAPLYKSIDDLTAVIAARDGSIAEQQGSIAALQDQMLQLEQRLETKRGKKQAYKVAFVGKVRPISASLVTDTAGALCAAECSVPSPWSSTMARGAYGKTTAHSIGLPADSMIYNSILQTKASAAKSSCCMPTLHDRLRSDCQNPTPHPSAFSPSHRMSASG